VTYQVKAEAVKAIQSRSKTQKLVADQLGVARSTVSTWVKDAARIQQHADLKQQRLRDEL
jgi:transposase-like protein